MRRLFSHLRPFLLDATTVATLAVVLTTLASVPVVFATPPDPDAPELAGQERVDTLIARIKHEQEKLTALKADFVQNKESQLLLEPEQARGSFAYRSPDEARWEFVEPDSTLMVITGEEMVTWYRDLGTAERVDVGKQSAKIAEYLNASNSLAKLERYFDFTVAFPNDETTPYRIELTPRFARVEKRLRGMTIWFDRELFVPVRLWYEEADGDTTEYLFESIEVNPPLTDDMFALELPADVEVRTVAFGAGR
ncbi:MAG: outer membrane lipoprotein carrier protein LolA [Acidobacteriota bacterium]